MRKIGIIAGLVFICLLPVSGENRYSIDLPYFDRIETSGSFTAVLEKSAKPGLHIMLENSSIDDITWYVTVKTLVIKKKTSFPDFSNVKVIIYYDSMIKSLVSKRESVIKNIRSVISDKIMIDAVSGGILDLRVEAESIEARSSRNSKINLSGRCRRLFAQADSGGIIESYQLDSRKTMASAHTGGILKVYAGELIEANAGVGSRVYFKGNPAEEVLVKGSGGEFIRIK